MGAEVDLADDSGFQTVGAGFDSQQRLQFIGEFTAYGINGEPMYTYREWRGKCVTQPGKYPVVNFAKTVAFWRREMN